MRGMCQQKKEWHSISLEQDGLQHLRNNNFGCEGCVHEEMQSFKFHPVME
ncbi:MAG: hypothetical protein GDYSWBUE_001027 [Candidatus Fervidibacterota bacterium]